MEELLDKIDNLKKSLNKEKPIVKINKLNYKIKEDNNLLDLLNKYKLSKKETLKKEIYNNSLFKEYKETETDINLLIMSINTKLKEINNRSSCQ